jgi:hypothetical protein
VYEDIRTFYVIQLYVERYVLHTVEDTIIENRYYVPIVENHAYCKSSTVERLDYNTKYEECCIKSTASKIHLYVYA